jgi:hypothetical protein
MYALVCTSRVTEDDRLPLASDRVTLSWSQRAGQKESDMLFRNHSAIAIVAVCVVSSVHAGVGDPQVRTDHLWYPGELACSTFDRLFATQARLYEHVVGVKPTTDEQKALAAWLWRNTHYYHGEEGTFEFYTPYIIGATPPNQKPWGIYDAGCRNGLVLRGQADCAVSISTDQGKNWHDAGQERSSRSR